MSAEYNKKRVSVGHEIPGTAIGARMPISHPQNCAHECPYGRGRDFCFPCYKKIMDATRTKKVQRA